ncbi:RING-H2 finger protein ATL43-like [Gastrolobium bilobum]|uniref:RING-H2 finger protein ATL43-like n=1 Tax=Gastrolobium bilobum TaxID=150636 RepID=UPI002AB28865|nr:RING-H2 finger protein ATL43-like [Gastrolobium bilobum]
MGGAPSFKPFNLTLPFFPIIILTITTLILIAGADNDSSEDPPPLEDNNGATTPPQVMPAPAHRRKPEGPVRPSTAVVMGVLITTFSLTFLLLLYIKHCNGGHIFTASDPNSQGAPPSHERKNSGIERAVVESLPVFRFGSLRGQKGGLDCAVCLARFEDIEVLRLLPKCKHAFHLECVDTWLDAHSTCPLCRYKVDPEDIVLVETKVPPPPQQNEEEEVIDIERGRNNNNNVTTQPDNFNSSVGERDGEFLQVILQTPNEQGQEEGKQGQNTETSSLRKTKSEGVGCFVRAPRKDGTLLTQDGDRTSAEHRLEHRIIVSPGGPHHQQQRWSDVHASDLLYLTSEMIISDAPSTRGGRRTVRERNRNVEGEMENGGRGVMNLRSVSAMTGLSRFMSREREREGQRGGGGEEQEGVVSRWLGWISKPQPRGDVR